MKNRTSLPLLTGLALGALALGCNPMPLTSGQLYGSKDGGALLSPPPADAGAPELPPAPPEPAPDATAPEPDTTTPDAGIDAEPPPDLAPDYTPPTPDPDCPEEPPLTGAATVCEPNRLEAGFSGGVIDECDDLNTWTNANVSIGNQFRCSGAGKGAFDFSNLQHGCKLTVVAGKKGYHRYCRVITVPRQGFTIRLKRIGGCQAPRPAPSDCVCSGNPPGCIPSSAP